MKKQVYICAPLLENRKKNIAEADKYRRYAITFDVSPVSVHEDYRVVNWIDKKQSNRALENSITKIWCSDEMWVMGDIITDRMRDEIEFCNEFNIPVRYISNSKIKNGVKPYD